MPAERFFVENDLNNGHSIILEEQEFHHLAHVMRVKTGEEVELVNGRGFLALASVKQIEKKRAVLTVNSVIQESAEGFEVILAQANPRASNLEFILEKGTELGMTQLWLFPTSHGGRKRYTEQQFDRMRSVTISALKQCGRLYLPKILEMPSLDQWNKLGYPAFFGDIKPEAPWFTDKPIDKSSNGVIFFVGPESGLSDVEIQLLRRLSVTGVKLNRHILRAETAAITALAVINSH
jgi:16S rRNA (uracil1498-N3)-methyltransferase